MKSGAAWSRFDDDDERKRDEMGAGTDFSSLDVMR